MEKQSYFGTRRAKAAAALGVAGMASLLVATSQLHPPTRNLNPHQFSNVQQTERAR